MEVWELIEYLKKANPKAMVRIRKEPNEKESELAQPNLWAHTVEYNSGSGYELHDEVVILGEE